MGSSTAMMFAMSFGEGQEQLQSEQYEDAMRSLAHAHQVALELGDTTGAYLSCDYLLESIKSACTGSGEAEEEKCCSTLEGFLRGNNINEVEARAWAAYYVGRSLFLRGEDDMDERAVDWLQICCELASTDNLKYEARMCLGNMFAQRSISTAVAYYRSAMEAAGNIVILQIFTLYRLCPLLCTHNMEEAVYQLSYLTSLADLSDDPFVKGVSARLEGYIRFRLHQFHHSKKANKDAISLLNDLPVDLQKYYDTLYSPLLGDPSYSLQRMKITAESFASACNELGTIELRGDNLVCAISAFQDALQYNGCTPDVRVDALSGLASIYFWQRQLEEADAKIDEILELSEDSYQSSYALVLRARVTWGYHEDKLSEEVFTKAYGFLEEAEKKLATKWPRDLGIIQHWQGILCAKMLKLNQAIKKFEQSLNRFWEVEAMLGPSGSEGRISHLEFEKFTFRWLQICLVDLEPPQVKRAIIWSERERARELIRAMNGNALDVDAGQVSFDSKDEDMIWEEIESIVSLAGEDSVFLMFTQLQNDMAITYLLHTGDEPKFQNSIIRIAEDSFLNLPIFSTVDRVDPTKFKSTMAQQEWQQYFHMVLIEPWKDDLDRIKPSRIILLPTEELYFVPFAALRDRSREDVEDEPYLIQQYALAYAPSLQVFKQCELQWKSLKSKRPSHEQMAIVVGNPTLKNDPKFPSLQGAQKEADHVAEKLKEGACFSDVILLEGDYATVDAVLDSLTRCSWVHMACHGLVDADYPSGALLLGSTSDAMQPGLASVTGRDCTEPRTVSLDEPRRSLNSAMMVEPESATQFRGGMANRSNDILHDFGYNIGSPGYQAHVERTLLKFGQQKEAGCSTSAGRLTGDDMNKRLQASGVVLSACQTGLGQVSGEGNLGLCRSFHGAGVPATLVSLWQVGDTPTFDFMQLLYSNLCDGMELAHAVQSAMKTMIEKTDDMGNPIYDVESWAAFVMSGSPFVKLVY